MHLSWKQVNTAWWRAISKESDERVEVQRTSKSRNQTNRWSHHSDSWTLTRRQSLRNWHELKSTYKLSKARYRSLLSHICTTHHNQEIVIQKTMSRCTEQHMNFTFSHLSKHAVPSFMVLIFITFQFHHSSHFQWRSSWDCTLISAADIIPIIPLRAEAKLLFFFKTVFNLNKQTKSHLYLIGISYKVRNRPLMSKCPHYTFINRSEKTSEWSFPNHHFRSPKFHSVFHKSSSRET